MIKCLIDEKLLKFIIVGILNTIVGVVTMFLFYNQFNMGYWGASALSYFLGSTMSFFLNKKFTFNSKMPNKKAVVRFSVTILICYIFAYVLAKPLVIYCLNKINLNIATKLIEQIAMLVGMGLFTISNYIMQRYFAFKE